MANLRSRLYLVLIVGLICLHFLRLRSCRNDGQRPPHYHEFVMANLRPRLYLVLIVGLLSCLIGLSVRHLTSRVRFGLEFRNGPGIYYVTSPAEDKASVSAQDLLATASILRQRADRIGMAEPEIHLEGENHIRVKLA